VPKFDICIQDTGEHFACNDTRSVLEGMESLGRRGIPVGCRNGGCGVCKVHITAGTYVARVMSREYVSVEDERAGHVLACRVRPSSDLQLQVIGKMKKNVCRVVEPADVRHTTST